jgi:hypothetical protein
MFSNLGRGTAVGLWFAVMVGVAAGGVFFGVDMTPGTGALLLAACLVPPAILLFMWRGAPPPTVAQLLHAVDAPDRRGDSA